MSNTGIADRRDVARARPLLAKAREHEISDLLAPFLTMAEGVVALEEHQPETARRLLEAAVTGAERFRHTTALMGGAIDRIHVFLCLACAESGDLPAARRHFRLAEPRLRAHGPGRGSPRGSIRFTVDPSAGGWVTSLLAGR